MKTPSCWNRYATSVSITVPPRTFEISSRWMRVARPSERGRVSMCCGNILGYFETDIWTDDWNVIILKWFLNNLGWLIFPSNFVFSTKINSIPIHVTTTHQVPHLTWLPHSTFLHTNLILLYCIIDQYDLVYLPSPYSILLSMLSSQLSICLSVMLCTYPSCILILSLTWLVDWVWS